MTRYRPGVRAAIPVVPLGGYLVRIYAPHGHEPIDRAQGYWVNIPTRELAPLIGPRIWHLVKRQSLDRRDGEYALGTPDLVAHVQLGDPLTGHWS